jgi:SLA1 homology domain 1, SHD1
MRNSLRSAGVGMLVSMLVIDPAMACRNCGQSWGYGGGYSYVSYESSCCYSPCQSCGGEVVVSEPCGGCSSCQSCSSCQTCGGDGQVIESEGPSQMPPPTMAPQPPASRPMSTPPAPTMPAAPSGGSSNSQMMPSTVNKPMESTPAPSLPSQTPASPAMPKAAEKAATPPQAAPSDDLFGAPAKPSDAGNDLFGAPSESKPAPAPAKEAPAASMPALPSTPAEKPSSPAADDLFGTPLSEPAAPAEKKSDEMKAPATSAPAEGDKSAPADKDKDKKKDDDLFGGFGAILREPGGLASNEMRHWVDNTGNFSCEGRLVRVLDGQVQLLKDNGHNSTVPMGRLSEADLSFVYRQASAQRSQSADQTAQYTPSMIGN